MVRGAFVLVIGLVVFVCVVVVVFAFSVVFTYLPTYLLTSKGKADNGIICFLRRAPCVLCCSVVFVFIAFVLVVFPCVFVEIKRLYFLEPLEVTWFAAPLS